MNVQVNYVNRKHFDSKNRLFLFFHDSRVHDYKNYRDYTAVNGKRHELTSCGIKQLCFCR
jgi:hypothetical protein